MGTPSRNSHLATPFSGMANTDYCRACFTDSAIVRFRDSGAVP